MSPTRSTIDGGYELEAGSSGLFCMERDHRTYVVFFLFERSEFLIATSPKKNLRVFDYVAAAVLAADADAAVLVVTMTPPYVRQKRLLAG